MHTYLLISFVPLRVFSKNCPYIDKLILSNCKKITDRTALSLSKNCPHLMYLDLSSCRRITDATCEYLRYNNNNLYDIIV